MILELDCGNTQIKWRLVSEGSVVPAAIMRSNTLAEVLATLPITHRITRCRLASVRSSADTQEMVESLERQLGISVENVQVTAAEGRVRNGYDVPASLGVDRWLAMLAAFAICRGACVVVDLGTAVTVDFVGADGIHIGGYIVPGAALMYRQLLGGTSGVTLNLSCDEGESLPGRNTSAAVRRGCRLMLRSFIASQIEYAIAHTGAETTVFVTGGDRDLVADMPGVCVVEDLVFQGLACACP